MNTRSKAFAIELRKELHSSHLLNYSMLTARSSTWKKEGASYVAPVLMLTNVVDSPEPMFLGDEGKDDLRMDGVASNHQYLCEFRTPRHFSMRTQKLYLGAWSRLGPMTTFIEASSLREYAKPRLSFRPTSRKHVALISNMASMVVNQHF